MEDSLSILRANGEDNIILTEITIRSKAYWNYSEEQMQKWHVVLTISAEYISENETYKLVSNEQIVGYYSFIKENNSIVKLDNMFVAPEFIGKGYGKILMNDFVEKIRLTDTQKIILEADPNTETFYKKFGFVVIRKLQSSIAGRFLPVMEMTLK